MLYLWSTNIKKSTNLVRSVPFLIIDKLQMIYFASIDNSATSFAMRFKSSIDEPSPS